MSTSWSHLHVIGFHKVGGKFQFFHLQLNLSQTHALYNRYPLHIPLRRNTKILKNKINLREGLEGFFLLIKQRSAWEKGRQEEQKMLSESALISHFSLQCRRLARVKGNNKQGKDLLLIKNFSVLKKKYDERGVLDTRQNKWNYITWDRKRNLLHQNGRPQCDKKCQKFL